MTLHDRIVSASQLAPVARLLVSLQILIDLSAVADSAECAQDWFALSATLNSCGVSIADARIDTAADAAYERGRSMRARVRGPGRIVAVPWMLDRAIGAGLEVQS